MKALIQHTRQLLWSELFPQIWTSHIPQKQCVSGQHRPRFRRLLFVRHYEADALCSVTRSFPHCNSKFSTTNLGTVVYIHVSELGASLRPYINCCTSTAGQFLVTRNEVRVQMRLNNVLDGQAI